MDAKKIYQTLAHYNACLWLAKEKDMPYEVTHFNALIIGYLMAHKDQSYIDETEYNRLKDLFINQPYKEC